MKYYSDKNVTLYLEDTFEYLKKQKDETFDVIIADPPYFLSNGGVTNKAGKFVSVNKGNWDLTSLNNAEEFYSKMIMEFYRVLKPNGTIWIFGTLHNIYTVGYLLKKFDFKILNNITWQKSNPAPNLSRKMFTHSTETILWAKKNNKQRYFFNYDSMRTENNHKQMKDVWTTSVINKSERRFGKHPTQKPLALLLRIIKASVDKDMVILDPFIGSGTTAVAADILNRKIIGIDNFKEYLDIAKKRVNDYKNERIGKIK